MADPPSLRMRRSRAHAAGDHSLCKRCNAVPRDPVTLRALPSQPEAFDAKSEMQQLAERLADAHRAEPANALLARELRMTLHELMPKDAGSVDADLTGLFAALQA